MFAPKDWISLRDVYEYFVGYFSENDALGKYEFTGDECFELTCFSRAKRKKLLSILSTVLSFMCLVLC